MSAKIWQMPKDGKNKISLKKKKKQQNNYIPFFLFFSFFM